GGMLPAPGPIVKSGSQQPVEPFWDLFDSVAVALVKLQAHALLLQAAQVTEHRPPAHVQPSGHLAQRRLPVTDQPRQADLPTRLTVCQEPFCQLTTLGG